MPTLGREKAATPAPSWVQVGKCLGLGSEESDFESYLGQLLCLSLSQPQSLLQELDIINRQVVQQLSVGKVTMVTAWHSRWFLGPKALSFTPHPPVHRLGPSPGRPSEACPLVPDPSLEESYRGELEKEAVGEGLA